MTQFLTDVTIAPWNMDEEGITHINIHPKSKSPLGRLLSNHNDEIPAFHPTFGYFKTLTGFWWFLKTGACKELYRFCTGYEADKIGSSSIIHHNPHLIKFFRTAILSKFESSPELLEQFINNKLELVTYKIQKVGSLRQPVVLGSTMLKKQIEFYNTVKNLLLSGKTISEIKSRYAVSLFENQNNFAEQSTRTPLNVHIVDASKKEIEAVSAGHLVIETLEGCDIGGVVQQVIKAYRTSSPPKAQYHGVKDINESAGNVNAGLIASATPGYYLAGVCDSSAAMPAAATDSNN